MEDPTSKQSSKPWPEWTSAAFFRKMCCKNATFGLRRIVNRTHLWRFRNFPKPWRCVRRFLHAGLWAEKKHALLRFLAWKINDLINLRFLAARMSEHVCNENEQHSDGNDFAYFDTLTLSHYQPTSAYMRFFLKKKVITLLTSTLITMNRKSSGYEGLGIFRVTTLTPIKIEIWVSQLTS